MDSKVVLSDAPLIYRKAPRVISSILKCPVYSVNKTGELSLWTCQSIMHIDESAVDILPVLHLIYISIHQLLQCFQKKRGEADRKDFT
jgi:uncharacterized membrane protein